MTARTLLASSLSSKTFEISKELYSARVVLKFLENSIGACKRLSKSTNNFRRKGKQSLTIETPTTVENPVNKFMLDYHFVR